MKTDFHANIAAIGSYKNSKLRSRVDWDNAWAQPKFGGVRALLHSDCVATEYGNLNIPSLLRSVALSNGKSLEVVLTIPGQSEAEVRYCLEKFSFSTTVRRSLSRAVIYICDVVSEEPFEERWRGESRPLLLNCEAARFAETIVVASPEDVAFCQYEFTKEGYSGVFVRHGIKPYSVYTHNCKVLDATCHRDDEFVVVDVRKNFLICETFSSIPFEVEPPAASDDISCFIGKVVVVRSRCDRNRPGSAPTLPVVIGVK